MGFCPYFSHDATSMRQSAEWGMRAFQSLMSCIKDRMKFEERGGHKVMLTVMILLYYLRAQMGEINQLNSFYVGAHSIVMQTLSLYLDWFTLKYSLILILCYSWVLLLLPSPSLCCSVLLIPANMFTTPSFRTEPEAFRPIILIIIIAIAIMFC